MINEKNKIKKFFKKFGNLKFFCMLQFELQQILKMFWQWCRKVFSNLAMRGIVPLSEVPFVFNSLCLTGGERERESIFRNQTPK